jgi:hypothetical protein
VLGWPHLLFLVLLSVAVAYGLLELLQLLSTGTE